MSELPPEPKSKLDTPRSGSDEGIQSADATLVQTLCANGRGRLVFNRFRLVRELGNGGMAEVNL